MMKTMPARPATRKAAFPTVRASRTEASMIEWKDLSPAHGEHPSASGLNFKFRGGRVYGIAVASREDGLALADVAAGCRAPGAGCVRVNGTDVRQGGVRVGHGIGYAPAIPSLYGEMTPRELLTFVARADGREIGSDGRGVERWLEAAGLTDVADRLIFHLGAEEKRLVCVAQATLGAPPLMILNEPYSDLSPRAATELTHFLQEVCGAPGAATSTVIFIAPSEALPRALCDEILSVGDAGLVPEIVDAVPELPPETPDQEKAEEGNI